MSEPRRVGHLIHIGYPKAGSTFLQGWFAAHPQVAYLKGGIAGYGDVWQIAREAAAPRPGVRLRVTSAEWLAAPFEFAGTERHMDLVAGASGEAVENVARDLATLFPAADVLLVTRGFRSVVLSQYSQYVREAGTMPFTPSTLAYAATVAHAQFDYDRLIRAYESAGDGRLMVLPYELLREDPGRFTRTLESKFGLEHMELPLDLLNPSLCPVELAWYPRLSRLVARLPLPGRARRAVLDAYVLRTRENRFARLIRVLQRLRPVEPLNPALVTDEFLEIFRGRAESLRSRPLYEPYLADYLL